MRSCFALLAWVLLATSWSALVHADVRGSLSATVFVHPDDPRFADQAPAQVRAEVEGKMAAAYRLSDGLEVEFEGRATAAGDAEDTFFADASKAALSAEHGDWILEAGMLDLYWGFLNAENLVDIFNQRDLVRDYQGDVHLGQPGASLRYLGESLETTLLFSPYSRERRLAEGRDRFRAAAPRFADADFEGGQWKPTMAAQIAYRTGALELEISHFYGHSREPELRPLVDRSSGRVELEPFYARIHQTGLAAQRVVGDYVLRGEALYRRGQTGGGFLAIGAGVERIDYGIFDSKVDLLTYLEGYWDDRPTEAPITAFDNDLVLGGTLNLNDPASTEFNGRVVVDTIEHSVLLDLSYQRRVADDFVLRLEISAPLDTARDRALESFGDDEVLRLSITRYL